MWFNELKGKYKENLPPHSRLTRRRRSSSVRPILFNTCFSLYPISNVNKYQTLCVRSTVAGKYNF